MRVGIATDQGGFGLEEDLRGRLAAAGHEVVEFGAFTQIRSWSLAFNCWSDAICHGRDNMNIREHKSRRQS
jgi:hypothetical protein